MTTFITNLDLSCWRSFIVLHGCQSCGDGPWMGIPRKCVKHSNKLYPLVLLCQQGRHFVRNKPSVRISAKKVRSMALLLADQLNVMCSKFTYSAPVLTHYCWVSKAQCIEGYQILINRRKRCQSYVDQHSCTLICQIQLNHVWARFLKYVVCDTQIEFCSSVRCQCQVLTA